LSYETHRSAISKKGHLVSSRVIDSTNPEDAVWVSCPDCDALPGDGCKLDPTLAGTPGYDKAVHQARISSMYYLSELERESA
jgi:hypothetical protein